MNVSKKCQEHWLVICSLVIMENMMKRLFWHIDSNESILDQRNNEHSTNQQPKKGEEQKSDDSA